ncbi:Co-chaperone Hsc20 [Calocera cornea HHB12733]|uniref:Co-chaperone Hsc20 n=1 Tax=Calocera cornea HHB12733 TaxID=1353952 RepID=A0A165E9S7_9BASI|nr:Co-chaperone Hsc20 [Calocera cornea HHB12733]
MLALRRVSQRPALSSRALPLLPTARHLPTLRHLSTPSASASARPSPPPTSTSRPTPPPPQAAHGTFPTCRAPFPTALPICASCGSIHPLPASTNYFALFDLPPRGEEGAFDLDPRELRGRFLRLQRACHPDAWGSKGEVERQRAADQSSLLNQAYKTLVSPLSRAQYLLSLNGHPSLETDSLSETSSSLLLEVLETREALEGAASLPELEEIRAANDLRAQEEVRLLSGLFAAGKWAEAKDAAVRLRYWQGIEDAVKERMSEGDL